MSNGIFLLLIAFYAGAVFASGRAWVTVWRGTPGYSALRDVTGIGDRAALRRLFGLTLRDGRYQVSLASVMKHRRPAGVLLTDVPVHLLFLMALAWATGNAAAPASVAIMWAAGANALIIAIAALSVAVASQRVRAG